MHCFHSWILVLLANQQKNLHNTLVSVCFVSVLYVVSMCIFVVCVCVKNMLILYTVQCRCMYYTGIECVYRWCRGSSGYSNILGQQVGGLLRQIRPWLPTVRLICWRPLQRLHPATTGRRWRVSNLTGCVSSASFIVLCYNRSMQYIDREGKEEFYGLSAYPETLYKKVTLLKYFRSYMSEHLLKVRYSYHFKLLVYTLYKINTGICSFLRLVLQWVTGR